MSFWSPNIEKQGRIGRAVAGAILCIAALVLFANGLLIAGIGASIGGLFCLFEAARGWCLLRACKIKTPM